MKKLFIIPVAGIVLIAGFLNTSIAGHHYHGCSYMSDMTDLDSNQDGMITLDEFTAPHMEKYKNAFKMLDTNDDEVIDDEEMQNFLEMHGYSESSKS